MAPFPAFSYDGRIGYFALQEFLIRYPDSVHERVMKSSFGLTMFQHGIDRFEGAVQKR